MSIEFRAFFSVLGAIWESILGEFGGGLMELGWRTLGIPWEKYTLHLTICLVHTK